MVMTGSGKFVEIQGTAEGKTFSHDELDMLLTLSRGGIEKLIHEQRNVLGPDAAMQIDDSIEYYGKA